MNGLNLNLEEVFKSVYRIPESSSQPSIDSYIRTSGKLVLFQITRNLNHSIISAGLIDLFKSLDILTGAKENPAFAVISYLSFLKVWVFPSKIYLIWMFSQWTI
jgi:hypothetical protein